MLNRCERFSLWVDSLDLRIAKSQIIIFTNKTGYMVKGALMPANFSNSEKGLGKQAYLMFSRTVML